MTCQSQCSKDQRWQNTIFSLILYRQHFRLDENNRFDESSKNL